MATKKPYEDRRDWDYANHCERDTAVSNRFDQPEPQLEVPPNTSGIVPKGHAVLLVPYEPEIKKSLIHIPETVRERTMMLEERGIVIAIGAACWLHEPEPRASLGDKVYIPYLAGRMVTGPADGKRYRIVNDNDIFAQIVKEKSETEEK